MDPLITQRISEAQSKIDDGSYVPKNPEAFLKSHMLSNMYQMTMQGCTLYKRFAEYFYSSSKLIRDQEKLILEQQEEIAALIAQNKSMARALSDVEKLISQE